MPDSTKWCKCQRYNFKPLLLLKHSKNRAGLVVLSGHGLYMGSFFVCVQLDKDLMIIKLELFYLPLLLCMFNLHVWITSQVIAIKNSLLRLRVAYLFSRPEWKWGGGAKGLIWFSLDSFPGVRLRFESNSGMPNMGKLSWALELKMSGPHAHTPCDLHWPSLKKKCLHCFHVLAWFDMLIVSEKCYM